VKVALIDYGMGNLHSVAKALEAAGADVSMVGDPGQLGGSDALCIPGQGVLDRCMTALRDRGFDGSLKEWIADERPYLGICLGMQLLFERSEEGGGTQGLGIFGGSVTRLPGTVTVPHIGWNLVEGEYFYFDHSFAVHPSDEGIVDGWCEHGERFAAIIQAGSVMAVQFHPEKSGSSGLELLRKWVDRS
jgi:imidazole glycerol phosphate synthase glutamine amidotransferase subunit